MAGVERIGSDYKVDRSYEDYSSQSIDKKGFKKKWRNFIPT